jgi:hypothetical protein
MRVSAALRPHRRRRILVSRVPLYKGLPRHLSRPAQYVSFVVTASFLGCYAHESVFSIPGLSCEIAIVRMAGHDWMACAVDADLATAGCRVARMGKDA